MVFSKIFKPFVIHFIHASILCFVAYWAKLWTTVSGLAKDMLTAVAAATCKLKAILQTTNVSCKS